MSVRISFVEHFGEDQAVAIERAAEEHENGVHGDRGTDSFKWALCITIGYECWSSPRYREYHGITADTDAIKAWVREHGDLGTHDGDLDYLGLLVGVYDEYVSEAAK